jgi:WD40 repeat protein
MRPELLVIAALVAAASALDAAGQALDSLGDPLPEGAIQRLGTLRLSYRSVGGLAYLDDTRAAILTGGSIDIWDLAVGERKSSTKVSDSGLSSVQLRADGQVLLVADSSGIVRELKVADLAELRSWETGISGLRRARYSPDESRVLTAGGTPPVVKEWDLATGDMLVEIHSEMATTRCGAIYGPEGKTAILGGGYEHILEHWDLQSGKLLHKWYTVYETKDLALSPDGKSVAAGVETHAAEWDLATYEMRHKYAHAPADGGRVFSVAYLTNTNEILCGGRDGLIYRWNRDTGELAFQWTPHQGPIYQLCVSPDEKRVLSFGSGQVVESDIRTGEPRLPWDRHGGSVEAVVFLPSTDTIVSASSDETLRVWDLATGKSVLRIPGLTLGAYAVAMSPDGERVAAGCKDGVIRVFSLADGAPLRELKGHLGYVRSVAYSSDGSQLLSSADDGSACVWGPDSAEPEARLEGHRGGVLAIAFSPHHRLALSGGRDGKVVVWDLEAGKLLRTLEGHRGWVQAAACAASGDRAVSGGRDGRVILWDIGSGELLAEMRHPGAVNALAISPDGRTAYSAGDSGAVLCWDLSRGEKVAEFKGHGQPVRGLALSPNGDRLITASADTTLLVWDVPNDG